MLINNKSLIKTIKRVDLTTEQETNLNEISNIKNDLNNIKNTELENLNTAIQTLETLVGDKNGLPVGDANIIASINRIDSKTLSENNILISPDNSKFKLKVDNSGNLSTEKINEYGQIILSTEALTINEGEPGSFEVKLNSAPTQDEVINLSVDNSNCTVSPTQLSFNSTNYSVEQTVTVNTTRDSSSYDDKRSVITLSNDNINSKIVNVTIVNTDEEPIRPTDISVTGITLSKETSTLTVGNSETLTYNIIPSNATNKEVNWSCNNDNCTVVDGLVTAIKKGSSVITVTTVDGNYSDSCNITIEENNISETDLIEGAKLSLRGKQQSGTVLNDESGNGYNASIERGTWVNNYISNPKIRISNETYPDMFTDNYFTYTIVASIGDSQGVQYLTRVTNGGTNTVQGMLNYIEKLNITLNCAGTWITTGEMEMVVDTKYVITIMRKQKDESNDVFEFYINNELKHSADISNTKLILKDSDFIVDLNNENSKLYDIVYYDKALTQTELTHNYNVLMKSIRPTGITLSKETSTLAVGNSEVLTYTITPSNATNKEVNWSCNNDNCTVVNGLVTAIKEGSSVITVTTVDGNKTANCNVTVLGESSKDVIEDGLVFRLDGKSTDSNAYLIDRVNGVICNILNTGYTKTNNGVVIPKDSTACIEIPASETNYGITNEMTLEVQTISPGTLAVFGKDGNSSISANNIFRVYINYMNTSDVSSYKKIENYDIANQNKFMTGLHRISVTVSADGNVLTYVDGELYTGFKDTIITDYKDLSPLFTSKNYSLKDTSHSGKSTDESTFVSMTLYNRALSADEIKQNYDSDLFLENIQVLPEAVNLNINESRNIYVTTSPSNIKNECNFIFNSGNEGFVSANDGVLLGKSAGTTIVNIIASYKDRTINKFINVTVGNVSEGSSGDIVPSRTPTGIVINNPIEEINVGEYYPLMATAIPYDIMDENLVKFSSSNPEVCSIDYGVIAAHKEGNAEITVSTLDDSISTSFNLKINPNLEIDDKITKIKNLTLAESGLVENDNSYLTAKNNTINLQNIINEAINNNYQKLVLPNGKFYITPEVELVPESEKQLLSGWSTPSYSITINKPGDDVFVLDFNGSEFEIIQSYWTLWKYGRENENSNKNGYCMFTITENSSNVEFRNGTINGERYTMTYPESEFDASEMCMSLNLGGTNNGIYNMSFNNSPGFNVGFAQARNIIHNGVPYTNFEAGGFDDNGNKLESIETGIWRTIDLMEINKISNSYAFGFIFGYHGFSYLRSRLYSIYFYDENRNFIECQKYNLQYYKYTMPQNTKYYSIEIYQESAPTSGYSDYNNAVANLYEPIGEKCYARNCTFKNNYSSGIALTTRNAILENNILENNGQRAPLSGFVFEDGWENMIGNIIVNNKFKNNGQGLCTCAGHSFVIYNNIFENDGVNIYNRTQHTRMYKNIFIDTSVNFSTQGDSVYAKNSFSGKRGSIKYGKYHETANYEVRVIE